MLLIIIAIFDWLNFGITERVIGRNHIFVTCTGSFTYFVFCQVQIIFTLVVYLRLHILILVFVLYKICM